MQKPNSYDSTQSQGGFTPIELGGHFAVVKKVEETTSSTGRPMIKVAIDFDKNDIQPEYFMESFKSDIRPEKKWPYQATQYILCEDNDGNCSRQFKTFVSAVEKSNNAQCVWGDGFAKWFTNKKIGVVYGEVEEEYNGQTNMRRRLRWFCEYSKADKAGVPEARYLSASSAPAASVSTTGTPTFMPETDSEEIPF